MGIIFLIIGVVFIVVGIFIGGLINIIIGVEIIPEIAKQALTLAKPIFQLAFGGGGVLLTVLGVIFVVRGNLAEQATQKILADGISGQGTIKFIDHNKNVIVNDQMIYSIVEYSYQDGLGNEYVNRVEDVSSEYVTRAGWQIGTTISIKYLQDNPQESAIVMD